MDLFTQTVTLTAGVIGLVVLYIVVRVAMEVVAMFGIRPGFLRAVLGFVGGFFALPALIGLLRLLLTAVGFVDPNLPVTTGAALMFAGFGGLFGWLWGVGTFNPYSHEHNGMEHLLEMKSEPTTLARLIHRGIRGTPGFIRWLAPFIRPLLVALVVSVVVVAIFMVLGMIPSPVNRVQTDTPIASAVTPAGSIILPIGDGLAVNKTVFFVIIAGAVLTTMAIFAIVLALIMNALAPRVIEAKQAPPEPPKTEPALFRLIDFYVSWVGDILEGTRRSISR
jgi:hypothetical protein